MTHTHLTLNTLPLIKTVAWHNWTWQTWQPKAIAQLLEQPVHFAIMSVYSDLCSSLHIRACYWHHINKDEIWDIITLLSVIADCSQFTQQLCSRWSSKSQILCELQLVRTGSSTYVYASKSCWKPSSNTVEPHQSQHDHSIACIVAQHYASAIFVSLCFHSRKGKLGV